MMTQLLHYRDLNYVHSLRSVLTQLISSTGYAAAAGSHVQARDRQHGWGWKQLMKARRHPHVPFCVEKRKTLITMVWECV